MMLGSALQCLAMILLAYGLTQTDATGALTGKASYVAAVGLFLFIAAFVRRFAAYLWYLSANGRNETEWILAGALSSWNPSFMSVSR